MDQSIDKNEELPESCRCAEAYEHEPFLEKIAEEQEEELGYALPVMAELYNEMNHADPSESILTSDECQCDEKKDDAES